MQLAGNTAERNSGTRTHQPSLLAGILFDAHGNRMTPSYAVKKGTRYHYYVSRPLITCGPAPKWDPFQTGLNTLIAL